MQRRYNQKYQSLEIYTEVTETIDFEQMDIKTITINVR